MQGKNAKLPLICHLRILAVERATHTDLRLAELGVSDSPTVFDLCDEIVALFKDSTCVQAPTMACLGNTYVKAPDN